MNSDPNKVVVGAGINRVDGPRKVAGAAPYPSDVNVHNQAHAALVTSTVAAGHIVRIDTAACAASPGVVTVITHLDMPELERAPATTLGVSPPAPLQDGIIRHHGQIVAMVVADSPEQATAAARLVSVDYERTEPLLDVLDERAVQVTDPWGTDSTRGDTAAALASAEVKVEQTYTTPDNTNSPLGLFATLAVWDQDRLTLHDTTQWPSMVKTTMAGVFRIPESSVRVLAPYVGGAFGAGLRVWPHVVLTAYAARRIRRAVKLVLTRPQMFSCVGHRPDTVQWVSLAAGSDGELTAIDHRTVSSLAIDDDDYEAVSAASAFAYRCPNVTTRDRQARLHRPAPCSMRAPAEGQGNFALESAMDELAYALKTDPLELRLRNHLDVNPRIGDLPWSSKALRECCTVGAERFGWSSRDPEPGSMRDGDWLIGYGMAGCSYPWYMAACAARATVGRDGSALVRSAATDIGTGTYTVMAQLSAQYLGLPFERVRFDLGDSDMPAAPQAGGSGLTGALGGAIRDACEKLVRRFAELAAADEESPLHGLAPDAVTVTDGRVHLVGDPARGEPYTDILGRHELAELSSDGASAPASPRELGLSPSGAFGAKFVEVRVDRDLGLVRVSRVVSAIDGGRILNEKTARSQINGATIGGIGQALLEGTVTDPGTGRIANATFGDYLIPVNADIPDLDVVFVGGPDRFNPVGTKGIGEIGLVGVAAAVANAVHHATGKRVRSLPITAEALLPGLEQ